MDLPEESWSGKKSGEVGGVFNPANGEVDAIFAMILRLNLRDDRICIRIL
jgi:hypothetical protein